jgi:cell division protein FtsW
VRKSALLLFGLVVTAIVALGLVVVSSASEANADRLFSNPYYFTQRQFAYAFAGVLVAIVASTFNYRNWRDYPWLTWLFFGCVFGLLVLVLFFDPINGSRRWISFGGVRMQPSEFAKVATIISVSMILDKAGWRVELFKYGALFPILAIGFFVVPIVMEPDFGSAVVVGLLGLVLMFVGGVRMLHLSPLFALGVIGIAYKVFTNPNRMARIAAFFGIEVRNASSEAVVNASHQSYQALVAISRGGINGVGLNQSMQKEFYLPEAHTDFIFAIGAEEMGIFFSIGALLLFFLFFALSVYIARNAADRFGRFLVIGMATMIFFQMMFNIGVVSEALPTKGMALPFFSYGGTNMVTSFFAVGTILSVGIHSYTSKKHALVNKVVKRA